MANTKQYIKTKANYTLSKKHMTTYIGDIFEQDHLTITNQYDGVYDDSVTMFSDSNFKFRIRGKENAKKKHFTGNWLSPSGESDFWTEADCNSIVTTETDIKLKPNYTSIGDFAYFGSATELVKASIMDIILHYPGGIYYLGSEYPVEVNGQQYYLVANDFDIDIISMGCVFDEEENPMRVLSASMDKYLFGTTDDPVTSCTFTYLNGFCAGEIFGTAHINGTEIQVYVDANGDKKYLTNSPQPKGVPIVTPNQEMFNKMYDSLDDFSKVLLNYTTNPLFTTKFKTPHFNKNGKFWTYEKYTFPSISSSTSSKWFFSPRVSGPGFNGYIAKLLFLAEKLDEIDSDNLNRVLTHESILNLDKTALHSSVSNEIGDNDFDSSRMKAMLDIYARQFDDIKRFADNVKNSTKVSYDESDNIPDYFLSDKLDYSGWDVPNISPNSNNDEYTEPLYDSLSVGYNGSDCNISFNRRLYLNSEYIKSTRGTRYGIETILGMFGMKNFANEASNTTKTAGHYEIHEHIAIATEFPNLLDINLAIENTDDYDETYSRYFDYPIAVVNNGDVPTANYVIPWFDSTNEHTRYMYFQMNGGWANAPAKHIDLSITEVSAITETSVTSIYDETIQYLKYATTIDELTGYTQTNLRPNMVCYVENISAIYSSYNADSDDEAVIEEASGECFSHYFILKNTALSTFVGFVSPDISDGRFNCYGWRNVFLHEFDGSSALTCDGTCVLYLESLKSDTTGNNPHVGYGTYDNGMEYLEYFNQIFKNKIDTNKFSLISSDEASATISLETIKNIGFNVDTDLVVDDTKCHYFINSNDIDIIDPSILGSDEPTVDGGPQLVPVVGENEEEDDDMDVSNWDAIYDEFVNPEEGETYDELASLSVINVKNMVINFTTNNNQYYRSYIQRVIMPLLKQMIPSTTIFSYTFDDEESPAVIAGSVNYGPASVTSVIADGASPNNDSALAEFDIEQNTITTIMEVE